MKLKQLESLLQGSIPTLAFKNPKIDLEQYPTTPHIAASILHSNCDHFQGKSVIDLGVGVGILMVGALFLEADYVLGIDIDQDALNTCKSNLSSAFEDQEEAYSETNYDLFQADVSNSNTFSRLTKCCDTVVMNPPFGTRKEGIDMVFLDRALEMATEAVISLHKTSTRQGIQRRINKMEGIEMQVLAELRFDLSCSYKFHRKDSVDVAVDLIKFSFE